MTSRSVAANHVWQRLTAYQQQLLQQLIASARHSTSPERQLHIAAVAAATFRLDNSGIVLIELYDQQLKLFGITPTCVVVPLPAEEQLELQQLLRDSPLLPLAAGTVCQLTLRAATCQLQIARPGEVAEAVEVALPPPLRCQAYHPCAEEF